MTSPSAGVAQADLSRDAASPPPRLGGLSVSFVVIGRNEERHLQECLEAVLTEAMPGEEVLYVDSRSTDRSVKIAQSMAGVRTIVLDDPRPSAAKGRNRGWREASGDLVQFVDGDACLAAGWTAHAVKAFADPQIAAVSGTLIEKSPNASLYNRFAHLDWPRGDGEASAFGGIVMVRRACLELVGGFPEDAWSGEEPLLALELRRRGFHLGQLPVLMAQHDIDLRGFKAYWRRCVLTGISDAEQIAAQRALGVPWHRLRTTKNLLWLAAGLGVLVAGGLHPWIWAAAAACLALDLGRIAAKTARRTETWWPAMAYALHVRGIIVAQLWGLARWFVHRRSAARTRILA